MYREFGSPSGSTNLYEYVGQDPINFIDPAGKFAIQVGVSAGGYAGAGVVGGGASASTGVGLIISGNGVQPVSTASGQANFAGYGVTAGAGGVISVSPFANSTSDLSGAYGGFGFELGWFSGAVTFSSGGPTFSFGANVGLPGFAGFGIGGVQVANPVGSSAICH